MPFSVFMDLTPTIDAVPPDAAAPQMGYRRGYSLYSPQQMLEVLARAELRRRRLQDAMQSLPIAPERGVMPEPGVQPVRSVPFLKPIAPARPHSFWEPFSEGHWSLGG